MSNRGEKYWAWAWILLWACSAHAAGRLPGSYYNDFHFGYETPHTKWAKPLAQGPVRVFFIAPTHAAREITELAQRLDMQAGGETAIDFRHLGDPGTYGPYPGMIEGTSPQEKESALIQKLAQPYDVYVLGNFPLANLPVRLQYEMLRRVKEGAGLVLVYKREADERLWRHPLPEATDILSEIPLAGLSFYKEKISALAQEPSQLVRGFRLGEGRVVQIDYGVQFPTGFAGGFCLTPPEPYTYYSLTEYDYHQSLVAKAILWAAKRPPLVRFAGLPLNGWHKSDPAVLPKLSLRLRNTGSQPLSGELWMRVRNEWGEIEQETKFPRTLATGDNPGELILPRLPGGTHFVDLQFRAAGRVLGWASAAVLMQSVPHIKEIKLSQISYRQKEPCSGRIILTPAVAGAYWTLRISLLDNYGRLFAQKQYALQNGQDEKEFALSLQAAVSLAGRVRAVLMRGDTPWDQKEAEFFVREPSPDDFLALVWGNLPGIFGHFAAVRLREAGFNSILHYYGQYPGLQGEGRMPEAIAREDFHAVPYVTRISWENGRLGDIENNEKARQELMERAKASFPFAPLLYSLGDENYIPPEGGFHENERPAFTAFLKNRYNGDIRALNAAWGADFKDFAEAAPVNATQAMQQKNWTPFHDTETFREYLYAKWHHWAHDVIKTVDPEGKIGAEGSEPGDLELTIQGLEFWGPYRRIDQNTLLRSLAPRELIRGNWFGGYNHARRDLPGLPRFLWESILDGSNLLEIYCSYTCENFYNTDLTWAYWMDTFLPDVKEITEGLGQLLAHSEHDCDAVAVYHSQPSLHLERLSQPFGAYERAMIAALRLLEDLSYVPYNITSRQIEAGLLRQRPPKLLLLPHMVCLSDREIAELEHFVQQGGLLIADVRPGIANGHGALRPQPALDSLFGVQRDPGLGSVSQGSGQWGEAASLLHFPAASLSPVAVDASLKLTDGIAWGKVADTPICIRRQAGQGIAILLNFSFSEYSQRTALEGQIAPAEALRNIIKLYGPKPQWDVKDSVGKPWLNGRVSAFRRGKAKIVGILPGRPENVQSPVSGRIQLAAPAHIYNMREGKYLGRTAQIHTEARFTSPVFLSALPYRVQKMTIQAPARHMAGTACPVRIALVADGDVAAARPVWRLNVIGPEGGNRPYYARTLYPEGLQASAAIPFALNDSPGKWLLVVRDILTGLQAKASVQLEAKK